MKEGLSKQKPWLGASRSFAASAGDAATDSARRAYWERFERRGVFLSGVAKGLWKGATVATISRRVHPANWEC